MILNSTQIIEKVTGITSTSDLITAQADVFKTSIIVYFIIQFLITSLLGIILVRKDIEKFWVIFILTQLIGGILLFFTFWLPILPQLLDKMF